MNNKLILVVLVLGVVLFSITGCSNSSNKSSNVNDPSTSANSFENIDGSGLLEILKDKNTVVIDVREPSEYDGGHIEKSVLIPLGQLQNQINQLDKSKTYVLVCASGARSAQGSQIMIDNGFTKVKNLQGGVFGNSQLPLIQ